LSSCPEATALRLLEKKGESKRGVKAGQNQTNEGGPIKLMSDKVPINL